MRTFPTEATSAQGSSVTAYENQLAMINRQLRAVSSHEWKRSFFRRNKHIVRRTTRKRALEKHKAAKHQPELVLTHFRNPFHAEVLAQIQWYIARSGEPIPGFARFGGIIQEQREGDMHESNALLEERGVCFVRTLRALKSKPKLISDCFAKCGLLSGYNDVGQHFPPSLFSVGMSLRDPNLPKINSIYIQAMLSLKNLSSARGSPITIPEIIMTE